ncbi:DUF5343 domain-containing protein [Ornithinibacillus bavariensis]|uniref:Uncharacterized protein n=1 Tax=Ornithinibacillus bavariensis TaxID=545502 RepID=A0A919X944_9BACI|nr:DUF5343 domain-containing protein [Ornithinibacillus bavariensis]GIO28277.1 hypothetical protein J43TS3_28880 [Ornithinibacillus bavariensis]
MALANVYTQVHGQAPSKFTQQHLKDIGFASTNYRAFIPIFKALGFLSSEGAPTSRYHEWMPHNQGGKWVRL